MGKTGGKAVGKLERGPQASDWRCRELPALPIGSCLTGAPTHLLGLPTHRRDFGGAGAGRFLAPSPISTQAALWEAFWGRRGDALSWSV
jgi:hypothetical protein